MVVYIETSPDDLVVVSGRVAERFRAVGCGHLVKAAFCDGAQTYVPAWATRIYYACVDWPRRRRDQISNARWAALLAWALGRTEARAAYALNGVHGVWDLLDAQADDRGA